MPFDSAAHHSVVHCSWKERIACDCCGVCVFAGLVQLCRAALPMVVGLLLILCRSSLRRDSLCLSMSLLHQTKLLTPATITTALRRRRKDAMSKKNLCGLHKY